MIVIVDRLGMASGEWRVTLFTPMGENGATLQIEVNGATLTGTTTTTGASCALPGSSTSTPTSCARLHPQVRAKGELMCSG